MGIFCEINLRRPADGRYTYQPGSIISGEIRYFLQKEYEFTSITVSLKGLGHLYLEDLGAKRTDRMYKHFNDETYVDINNVIHTNEKEESIPVGQYQTQFSFQLPYNIPASIDYKKRTASYFAHSTVKYCVRIKFKRPGRFKLSKKYEKELNVISGQGPRLTTEPLIYGDQKKLLQLSSLFSSKKGVVNIKATIANSVLRPGETVKVDYEVDNDTNKPIKDVQLIMCEVDLYTAKGGRVFKIHTKVEGGNYIHEPIPGGETAKFTSEIMIPEHCASIDHSKFFTRDYSLVTLVRLPDPHINLPLELPFQVINTLSSSFEENAGFSVAEANYPNEDPPSYWEAMGEEEEVEEDTKEESLEKEN